jgi:hypothetical protein
MLPPRRATARRTARVLGDVTSRDPEIGETLPVPRGVLLPLLLPLALGVSATSGRAQRITRDNYLRFVPLEYPRIVAQTTANVEFQLFGDPTDPGYRDVDPVDGIDDAHARRLHDLAVQFAPFLVKNTTMAPMDFKKFMQEPLAFPLYVDTWEIAHSQNDGC